MPASAGVGGGEDEGAEGNSVEYGGGRARIVGGRVVVCPILFGIEKDFKCQFLEHPNIRYQVSNANTKY